MVKDSIPDDVTEFYNLPNPSSCSMGPEVYSASNRNEHQIEFLGSKAQPACKSDVTAIYEPIV
jgi:hypothetical protein